MTDGRRTNRSVGRASAARWLVAAGVTMLLVAHGLARAATTEECRAFERECTEAEAAGFHDVGICKVERLECSAKDARGVKPLDDARDGDDGDPDRALRRSVLP